MRKEKKEKKKKKRCMCLCMYVCVTTRNHAVYEGNVEVLRAALSKLVNK